MNRYEECIRRAKSSYELSLSKETISYLGADLGVPRHRAMYGDAKTA